MEKGKSKANLPSTSDGIKAQEEAERLVEEETTMRKEVELFLQEELSKLLAEKDTVKKTEPFPRRTSQESQLSGKPRPQLKRSKVGAQQSSGFEKSEVEEDLLTLLDEPWDLPRDLPRDPVTGEVEDQWDKLSLLEESMLELRPQEKKREEDIPEEEEKKEGESQVSLKKDERLVEMSHKSGQLLIKPVSLDREEEATLKEESKHSLWSRRSDMGAIFEQKLQQFQKQSSSITKKGLASLPFGYFTRSERLPSKAASEKEHPSEELEPHSWMPGFLKKSKPKKIAGFRKKSGKKLQLEGDQVTDLSKIFSEDFFKSQDRRASEEIADEDLPPSPDDNPQQSEEELKQIREETKKRGSESFIPPEVPSSSLFHMGHRIDHRDMGHLREFPDSVFKDKSYKQRFVKHERDSKVAMPLPLQELLEEEVLVILKATLLAYQKKLGANHPLTGQMEKQVDKLHLQLQGRGII